MSSAATKQDFTQKLLNDLRLRKQRMASAQSSVHSSSSSSSSIISPDANRSTGQTFRGYSDTRGFSNPSSRAGYPHGASSQRLPVNREASNQMIVPFGKGCQIHGSEKTLDLSMTLSYALDNNGNLNRKMNLINNTNNAMVGILQQISGESMDWSNIGRSHLGSSTSGSVSQHWPSTTQFPTLTVLHIDKISKGAQKLNRVLNAFSSGGVDLGQCCSVDIGKELLKEAMDLEESLRMLVSLQEASEYMASPQRKSQVRLLEAAEDEDSKSKPDKTDKMHVERPVFSFDKASRNSKVNSHRRSASLGAADLNTVASVSTPKQYNSSSQSRAEGTRISNVVAKLMGLEEVSSNQIPNKITPENPNVSIKKSEQLEDKTRIRETRKVEMKSEDARDGPVRAGKQEKVQSKRIVILTPNKEAKEKIHSNLWDERPGDSSPNWSHKEREHEALGHNKESPESNLSDLQSYRMQITKKGRESNKAQFKAEDDVSLKEPSAPRVFEDLNIKEAVLKGHQKQKPKFETDTAERSEPTKGLQGKVLKKENKDKKGASNKLPTKQPGIVTSAGYEDRSDRTKTAQRYEPARRKQKLERRSQKKAQNKSPVKKAQDSSVEELDEFPKDIHEVEISQQTHNQAIGGKASGAGSENQEMAVHTSSTPPEQHDNSIEREEKSTSSEVIKPESPESSRQGKSKPLVQQEEIKSPITRDMKTEVAEKRPRKSGIAQKVTEILKTKTVKSASKTSRAVKQQMSSLTQGVRLRKDEKMNNPKGDQTGRKSKSMPIEVNLQRQKESTKDIMVVDEQNSKQLDNPTRNDRITPQDVHCSPSHQENQQLTAITDQKPQPPTSEYIQMSDADISGDSSITLLAKAEPVQQQPLTNEEVHLKQTLITSQHFVNMAEALFKLNIPIGILNYTNDNDICSKEENSENKLLIDCAHEMLKKKGRREERVLFRCSKSNAFSRVKPRCLDDLVKEICKDFESLREYGLQKKGGNNRSHNEVEYLLKMLERDVCFGKMDTNSMWEMGWHETVFAHVEVDEVVRDVESGLIEKLIEETVEGLLKLELRLSKYPLKTETFLQFKIHTELE